MDYEKVIMQMIKDGIIPQKSVEKYCPELVESDDERIRKWILALVKQHAGELCGEYENCIAWLEKKGGQKPTEWSEEDKNHIETLLLWLRVSLGHEDKSLQDKINIEINWLKSLKGRFTWKPSDEQMDALYTYIYNPQHFNSPDPRMELVESVYKDLMKLREE